MRERTTIFSGFKYGEGPRWYDGALWFSDVHSNAVWRLFLDGEGTIAAQVPDDKPSGLGWLPDGRLLVVAMIARKLMRLEPNGQLVEHADLSGIARGCINDMIVAADGTAYVGDAGIDYFARPVPPRVPGQTIRVTPDGDVSCAADDLEAPNGHILTEDGGTLIVAEAASRLTAFDVGENGELKNRRVFASFDQLAGEASADGMCLDAEGAVWAAMPGAGRLVRVAEGGEVLDSIDYPTDWLPVACVLGGVDRRTLLICASIPFQHTVERVGRIDAIEVDVPGAGRP